MPEMLGSVPFIAFFILGHLHAALIVSPALRVLSIQEQRHGPVIAEGVVATEVVGGSEGFDCEVRLLQVVVSDAEVPKGVDVLRIKLVREQKGLKCQRETAQEYKESAQLIVSEGIVGMLAQMELPQIAQYNQKYRIEAAAGTYTTARFLDDSLFLLLPPDPLGETLYGPTAEALMSDAGLSATEISGLYSTVTSDDDPPAIWTKVAATAIPTFSMADAVFIATVLS